MSLVITWTAEGPAERGAPDGSLEGALGRQVKQEEASLFLLHGLTKRPAADPVHHVILSLVFSLVAQRLERPRGERARDNNLR